MKRQQVLWTLLGAAGMIILSLVGAWGVRVQEDVQALQNTHQQVLSDLAASKAQYADLLRRLDKMDRQLDRIEARVSSKALFTK